MNTRIHMDNGEVITVDTSVVELEKAFKNQVGVVINGYVRLGNTLVNPNHVSFMEIVTEE